MNSKQFAVFIIVAFIGCIAGGFVSDRVGSQFLCLMLCQIVRIIIAQIVIINGKFDMVGGTFP